MKKFSILPKPLPAPPRRIEPSQPPPASQNSTEQSETPFRPSALTSHYYFALSSRLWNAMFISWPLDWLLLTLPHLSIFGPEGAFSPLRETGLLFSTILLSSGLALWLVRNSLIDFLFALQHVQQRIALSSLWPVIAIVGLVSITTIVELASHFSKIDFASVLVGLLILFGTISSILRAVRQRKAEALQLAHDPTGRVERANHLMFLLSILPPVLARLGTLVGVFTIVTTGSSFIEVSLISLAGLALILASRPTLPEFTFTCARCGNVASRALRAGSLCPSCLMIRRAEKASFPLPGEPLALRLLRKAESLTEKYSPKDAPPKK